MGAQTDAEVGMDKADVVALSARAHDGKMEYGGKSNRIAASGDRTARTEERRREFFEFSLLVFVCPMACRACSARITKGEYCQVNEFFAILTGPFAARFFIESALFAKHAPRTCTGKQSFQKV